MIDVRIKSDDGNFKFRVAGTIQNGDKYLFVKMNENDFYCLPGGHVELGETTDQAILREMKEELGYDIKISKYMGQIQNFFYNRKNVLFHELCYYYVLEPINKDTLIAEDYFRLENDKGFEQKLNFKWMTIEEAKKERIMPNLIFELFESKVPLNLVCDERN